MIMIFQVQCRIPSMPSSAARQNLAPLVISHLLLCLHAQGELRELIQELHEHGLKAVADIVINHRCAHFQVPVLRNNLPLQDTPL